MFNIKKIIIKKKLYIQNIYLFYKEKMQIQRKHLWILQFNYLFYYFLFKIIYIQVFSILFIQTFLILFNIFFNLYKEHSNLALDEIEPKDNNNKNVNKKSTSENKNPTKEQFIDF